MAEFALLTPSSFLGIPIEAAAYPPAKVEFHGRT